MVIQLTTQQQSFKFEDIYHEAGIDTIATANGWDNLETLLILPGRPLALESLDKLTSKYPFLESDGICDEGFIINNEVLSNSYSNESEIIQVLKSLVSDWNEEKETVYNCINKDARTMFEFFFNEGHVDYGKEFSKKYLAEYCEYYLDKIASIHDRQEMLDYIELVHNNQIPDNKVLRISSNTMYGTESYAFIELA
jgi:hypothetical protein